MTKQFFSILIIFSARLFNSVIGGFLGSLYALYLILIKRNLDILPALLLLFALRGTFSFLGYSSVNIPGLLTANFIILFLVPFLALKVFYANKQLPPSTFFLLIVWYLLCIIGCYGAYLGYQHDYYDYSRGMRYILALGGFFYGLTISKGKLNIADIAFKIHLICSIILLLSLLGYYKFLITFFCVPYITSYSVFLISNSCGKKKLLAWSSLGLATIYALTGTLTLFALFLGSLTLSLVKKLKGQQLRKTTIYALCFLILFFSVPFLFFTINISSESSLNYETEESYIDRLKAKMIGDRGPLWEDGLQAIEHESSFFVPSSRPLQQVFLSSFDSWTSGLHNIYLEVLWMFGYSGIIFLILYLSILAWAIWILPSFQNEIYILLGTSVMTCLVGMNTGQFPITSHFGFFLWLFMGIGIAEFYKSKT